MSTPWSVIEPPPKLDRSMTVAVSSSPVVSGSSSTWVITACSCAQVIDDVKAVRSILSPSVVLKSVIVSEPLSSLNTKVSAPVPPVISSSLVPPWSVSSTPSVPTILSRMNMSSVRSETAVRPVRVIVPPPKSLRSIFRPVTVLGSFGSVTVVIFDCSCAQVTVWVRPVRSMQSRAVSKSVIVSLALLSRNTKVSCAAAAGQRVVAVGALDGVRPRRCRCRYPRRG